MLCGLFVGYKELFLLGTHKNAQCCFLLLGIALHCSCAHSLCMFNNIYLPFLLSPPKQMERNVMEVYGSSVKNMT